MSHAADVFLNVLPLAQDLSMRFDGADENGFRIRLPFADRLLDAEHGPVHGAMIAALLDTAGGAAVVAHPELASMTATLNLRIDYLRPATGRVDLIATAHVEVMSEAVVHVRALCHEDGHEVPIAMAQGAFTR